MSAQDGRACRLLRLPRELRDMIYDHVFSSSRLRFGIVYENPEWVDRNAQRTQPQRSGEPPQEDWVLTEKTYRSIRPAPNTLALLRTCRQIHAETASLWPKRTLFAFDTLESMFDKFSSLPTDVVGRIRNIQLSPPHSGVKRYPLASMLKVIPQLNLDNLTVVMNYASGARQNCPDNQTVIDDMIRYGMGWRKLHFVTHDSLMLTSLRFDLNGNETRPPQPGKWAQTLAERDWDGDLSQGAQHVRIYRATDGKAGAVLDSARRVPFAQDADEKPPAWLEIEDRAERKAARDEDAERIRASERGGNAREILIVVERRKGVDVVERGEEPYCISTDFRAWMGGKTWKEYWTCNHHLTAELDTKTGDKVDEYQNPHEYQWWASERKGVTWPISPPPMTRTIAN